MLTGKLNWRVCFCRSCISSLFHSYNMLWKWSFRKRVTIAQSIRCDTADKLDGPQFNSRSGQEGSFSQISGPALFNAYCGFCRRECGVGDERLTIQCRWKEIVEPHLYGRSISTFQYNKICRCNYTAASTTFCPVILVRSNKKVWRYVMFVRPSVTM